VKFFPELFPLARHEPVSEVCCMQLCLFIARLFYMHSQCSVLLSMLSLLIVSCQWTWARHWSSYSRQRA